MLDACVCVLARFKHHWPATWNLINHLAASLSREREGEEEEDIFHSLYSAGARRSIYTCNNNIGPLRKNEKLFEP